MKFEQLTIDGAVVAKFGANKPPGVIIWYEWANYWYNLVLKRHLVTSLRTKFCKIYCYKFVLNCHLVVDFMTNWPWNFGIIKRQGIGLLSLSYLDTRGLGASLAWSCLCLKSRKCLFFNYFCNFFYLLLPRFEILVQFESDS